MNPALIFIDSEHELWERAWNAFACTGRDIDDGWMLMYATEAPVPGGYRFAFKNQDLPFMQGDPAYDGKTKYVFLPKLVAL